MQDQRRSYISSELNKTSGQKIRDKRIRKSRPCPRRILRRKIIAVGKAKDRSEMKRQIAEILRTTGVDAVLYLIHRLVEKEPENQKKERVISKSAKPFHTPALKLTLGLRPVMSKFYPRFASPQQKQRQQCYRQRDDNRCRTKAEYTRRGKRDQPENSRTNNVPDRDPPH